MITRPFSQGLRQLATGLIIALAVSMHAAADEITLNLKDADIRALISTVSKFTGKNFIIDPRVKAKVTVVSAETLTPEEVTRFFCPSCRSTATPQYRPAA